MEMPGSMVCSSNVHEGRLGESPGEGSGRRRTPGTPDGTASRGADLLAENRCERYGGGLNAVSNPIWVEVIVGVEVRQHEVWVSGIGEDLVEIGDGDDARKGEAGGTIQALTRLRWVEPGFSGPGLMSPA